MHAQRDGMFLHWLESRSCFESTNVMGAHTGSVAAFQNRNSELEILLQQLKAQEKVLSWLR